MTKGVTAKNFGVYSWPRGQTYNGLCQPEGATGVFAQTLHWQLTGCWPRRGKYPLVITPWADKHSASHLHPVCSSPRLPCWETGAGQEGWKTAAQEQMVNTMELSELSVEERMETCPSFALERTTALSDFRHCVIGRVTGFVVSANAKVKAALPSIWRHFLQGSGDYISAVIFVPNPARCDEIVVLISETSGLD
ncbi:hypothetical protein Anapl_01522 [Anas platyrhynchos]|uniref:Uncharacterized protein n=1 Tax=Anas platyrhynchos TaxID=8839 RepID=R0JX08_ANAPL|nr:hypothetical protein Anapl_01522 [Anas platyrhynchos]